jgi:hypothetical protein
MDFIILFMYQNQTLTFRFQNNKVKVNHKILQYLMLIIQYKSQS